MRTRKHGVSTQWISHRGYKKDAVENTREAFKAAVALGFTALETDLRLSADGHVVLAHDPDLERLAGLARPIWTMTRAELEVVPLRGAGELFFLEDFIREFAGCTWTFDVKPQKGAETVRALHALASNLGIHDWLMAQAKFLLWDRAQEQLLQELFPRAVCYPQERDCWRAGLAVIAGAPALGGIEKGRTYALPPRLGPLFTYTEKFVARYRKAGAKLLAFLPETEAETKAALDLGFDEILTNGPLGVGGRT